MARKKIRFPTADIKANLTPMVDVSFLLLVFFMLISRIGDTERTELDLAAVSAGAAVAADDEVRFVLNVIPAANGATGGYALNGVVYEATPDGIALLAESIAEGYRRNPYLAVNLRADRATNYEWVEPAMRATTTAARIAGGGALPRLNLVVVELDEPRDIGAPRGPNGAPRAPNGAPRAP